MNLLLDTHTTIWFITADKMLPSRLKRLIENSDNVCFVSIASLWEMAIKHSLGKLDLKVSLDSVFQLILQSGLIILPITPEHILTNAMLAFHHRDPFDRLIIAQAQSEQLTLVSRDEAFSSYDVKTIWDDGF